MFFMMGITPKQWALPFSQQGICPVCGRMSRFEVWVTAQCLSLFLIPVFRFGKRYMLSSVCCGAACELPAELGKAIERGEIESVDLSAMPFSRSRERRCPGCGRESDPSFQFCPYCGTPL